MFGLKKQWVWLGIVICLGIFLRLRNFSLPPIDAHAMRQTDTECVAHFMAEGKANLFFPKSCLIRPVQNTQGFFFLEFPVYEGIMALGYRMFGSEIEVVRIINLLLYVVSCVSLFYFLRAWLKSEKAALFSVLLFSLAPGSIFFLGHAVHPDVFAVTMMLVSLALLMKYLGKKKFGWLLLSAVSLGLSVATRPFGLICAPLYIAILWTNKAKWWNYLILGGFGIGFYGLWRWWTLTSGVDASWENWVLYGQEQLFNYETLKRIIWKNVVGEVMGKVISGLAVGGIMMGLIQRNRKILAFLYWLLMVPIYWYIVPNGNIIHQYYADIYIVPVVVLAAVMLERLWDKSKIMFAAIAVLCVWNGYRVSNYYFEDKVSDRKMEIAKELIENIPVEAKVLLLSKADPVTLSLSHRQGWMLGEWPTDVAPHIWAVMEMKNFEIDYLAEPKGSMDLKREDAVIIEENYPLFKETENLRILRWEKARY